MTITRKQLLSQLRMQRAKAVRQHNRDEFIRRMLRQRGARIASAPEDECFRGYEALVTEVCEIAGCPVAKLIGCAQCKNAPTVWAKFRAGGKIFPSDIKCKGFSPDLIWIATEKSIEDFPIIPGVYLVNRLKPLMDEHGHIIEAPLGVAGRPRRLEFDLNAGLRHGRIEPEVAFGEPELIVERPRQAGAARHAADEELVWRGAQQQGHNR
jgi:hypothetical protein